jgi:hypothetical protein
MFTIFAEIIAIVMAAVFAIANIAYLAPSSMSRLTFPKEKSAGHNTNCAGFSDSGNDSDCSSNDKSSCSDGALDDNAASGSNDGTTNKMDDGTVVEVKLTEYNTSRFPGLNNLADLDQITTSALNDSPGDSGSGSSGSPSGSSDDCSSSILHQLTKDL